MGKYISVIIPCHNCAESVETTWQSLKKQTIGIDNLECIFVDDASDDGGATWSMLQKIEHEEPESVMIIHLDENMRQGGARNVALNYCSGEYLMFLDADDVFLPESCEIAFGVINDNSADIVQFNHIRRIGENQKVFEDIKQNVFFEIKSSSERNRFLDASTVTYGCWNKIYRLSLVRKSEAKFSEHTVYEEPLFVYPCFLYATKLVLITDALYVYNIHSGSTVTSLIGKRIFDHPKVQLELLGYCIKRPELYSEYRDAIGIYFLWTYFCETICFSAQQEIEGLLTLDYFKGMQEVCRHFFSDWRENSYLNRIPKNVQDSLKGIEREFETQKELNEYVKYTASRI